MDTIQEFMNHATTQKNNFADLWYDYDEFYAKIITINDSTIQQFDIQFGVKELSKILGNLDKLRSNISELNSELNDLQYNDSYYSYWIVRPRDGSEKYIGLCSGFLELNYTANNYSDALLGIQTIVKSNINDLKQDCDPMPTSHLDHISTETLICGHCESDIDCEQISFMQKCPRCNRMVCNYIEEPDPDVGIWGGQCVDIICDQ